MPPMATMDSPTRRFAVACGVLSQYVKATAVPGAATRMGSYKEPCPPADGAPQLTIFYGGRVVVLDGCTPARAAEVIRYAASAAQGRGHGQVASEPALVDMPIARKASLQRFLAKRKYRSSAAEPAEELPPPAKKGKTEASSWLALGSLGDMHAQCDRLNVALSSGSSLAPES